MDLSFKGFVSGKSVKIPLWDFAGLQRLQHQLLNVEWEIKQIENRMVGDVSGPPPLWGVSITLGSISKLDGSKLLFQIIGRIMQTGPFFG